MIDIHSHVVFGVDDGAKTEKDTRDLLEESYRQGVRTIIATPHRRRGMFETDIEIIKSNFKRVEDIAAEVAQDLRVYLGSEVYYKEGEIAKIESGEYPRLAETDYVLVEFPYEMRYKEIHRALNKVILLGLTPVVAHVERYNDVDEKGVQELINMGAYIQINAASVLKPKLFGDKHKHYKKRAKKYLEAELVHFIASDMHNMNSRRTYMREAYDIIEEKYGPTIAYELFEKNQEKLLMNKIIYSIFLVTPQYSSTTKVYVVNQKKDDKAITTQDVQLGSLLVKDYKEIILSNKVMEDVADKSGTGLTAKELAKKVSVDAPKDTRIISITVRDKDPQVASELANTVKEVSADQIKEVTKIDDVTTLEEAKAATSPSSPNIPKNGILATVLGFIIAVAGVVLFELLDDRIKRAEDIEDGMGLVLLGVVPDTKIGKR